MSAIKIIFTTTLFLFSSLSFAAQTTVQGQDNSALDRAAIQSAIDNASPNEVIKLIGTFQLDGQQILINKSKLTIDGVGAAGNWDTVIKGITNSGVPAPDNGSNYFNRAFSVGPTTDALSKITIKNIKFTGLNRAITVAPSIQTTSSDCSATTVTQGSASNISINNNWIDNSVRGIQVIGTNDHESVADNLFTGILGRGIVVVGTITTCTPFPPGFIEIGLPSFVDITGNTIQNDASEEPIIVLAADHVTISKNAVKNSNNFVPIVVQGITNSMVSNNNVEGGPDTFAGIFAETIIAADPSWPVQVEPIVNSKILNNQIKNTPVAIVVDNAVSDLSVINNEFTNSSVADVWLCDNTADDTNFCDFFFPEFGATPPSSNNKVVRANAKDAVIVDHGVNNKIN